MHKQLATTLRCDIAGSCSSDASSQHSTDNVREAQKWHLYNKYSNFYAQNDSGPMLKGMVLRAVELDETSCIIFDERTDQEHNITASDLEEIFEDSLDGTKLSLKKIISNQAKGFRHIQKLRVAHTIDELEPYVTVQYVLVWERRNGH